MPFDYFDMLSGDSVPLYGVGHIRSPKLKELKPTEGIGLQAYKFYLNVLSWDKDGFIKYDQLMHYRMVAKLNRECFNVFDVVTLLPQTRELCRGVLSFFMVEKIDWNDKERKFIVFRQEDGIPVGEINRTNFEDIRAAILQCNYVGLDCDDRPAVIADQKTKDLWDKAQAFLKDQASKSDTNAPEYHLSNIISKVCAVHPSYNLLNVYELTIFQLYDAFLQIGYMRSADLSARIFSNHGGEKFRFEDWLRPITKNL